MAVDEFEIKQVHNEGNSSRSLVFKISKRINKTSKQQDMAAVHKDTSSNSILSGEVEVSATLKSEPCLSSEPNLHDNIGIKHLIETGAAGDAARPVRQVAEKFGAVLRRTSKRIVLRVRDPNIEVTDKTSTSQKIEDPSSESTKQGSSCGKMGRRRGGRKTLSEAVNPKSERRGRGRPRTVNRDQPAEKVGKIVSIKSSKTPKKSLAVVSQADSSSVWTLVPKELVNSDYFKSHILKMQDRPPRGRRPKKASRASHVPEIPHIPFIGRENIKVQFPKVPPVTTKPAVEQHPGPLSAPPSRPTVIYFKAQKNGLGEMEANPLVSNEITMPDQQNAVANSSEELQFSSYLRQSYGNAVNDAALGYIYGVSQRNVKRNEHLMRDVMSGRKQMTAERSSHSNQQHFLQSHLPLLQENNMEPGNELVLQANGYDTVSESPPMQSECYISCRQVVVDAIRMLYDEESILGYA